MENAEEVLEKHNRLTITTYGTRTSTKSVSIKREREGNKENEVSDQEKTMVSPIVLFEEAKMSMFFLRLQKQIQPPKLFWVHGSVDFNNTPFSIGEKKMS